VTTFERTYPRYHGHVIKPFNEADSLVLQVMYSCAHGKCIFCGSYAGKSFRLRPLDYIREDIKGVDSGVKQHVTRVFLSDGDVLTLPLARMVEILDLIRAEFTSLQRISAYATPHSLLPLTVDELREMREHGLELLYVGLESGDDVTLALSGRGLSAAQQVRAFLKAKQAGMALSVSTILGLAGVERSPQHARTTALALTAVDPEYIEVISLMLEPGTRLAEAVRGGQFVVPDAAGLLRELRLMLSETHVTQASFRTNHSPEYLDLTGTLPDDAHRILGYIDALLARGDIAPLRPEDLRGL
jgi:radical SAM superfamily enzyme YgiQ (UPF0313 family)